MTYRHLILHLVFFTGIVLSFQLIPSRWLETLTAQTTSDLLSAIGFSSTWAMQEGQAYVTLTGGARDVSAAIIRECTGLHVFAILTGLVLPLRGGLWTRKMLSLAVSGSLLSLMNLTRLILTITLTAYDIPPFAWIFTNPTIETYHYPLSLIYGILGVAILVVIVSKWTLPELGDTLLDILKTLRDMTHRRTRRSTERYPNTSIAHAA